MNARRHVFTDPDRFVVGTVGAPGERAFYLQAVSGAQVVTVGLEKVQAAALAERLGALLDDLGRRPDLADAVPGAAPIGLDDREPLDLPLFEEFRATTLALGWSDEMGRVVVEASIEDLPGEGDDDSGSDPAADEPAEDRPTLVVTLTPSAARAFADRTARVVAAGRAPCPICGAPVDPGGHVCPRSNGHRQ